MESNSKLYEVIEYFEDGTSHATVLLREQAESLYRKIRAKGSRVDIRKCVSKIKGILW